jgi:outer membrane protein assembly factor BamB
MNTKMMNKICAYLAFIFFTLLINGCSGFFDKDNTPPPTPLTKFNPEVQPRLLWSTSAGRGNDDDYLKMNPALTDTAIFTASSKGTVTSINKLTGHTNWKTNTGFSFSAGPGAGDGIVVVGSRKGDVIALQQADGRQLWRIAVPGEILANPAVGEGVVVIKAVDGYTRALSVSDGHELWSFQQVEPSLILRGASTPVIRGRYLIVGFANGNLAKLNLHDGQMFWLQTIAIPEGAFAIQGMIDIDANPVLFDHHIYVATYQGKIASLDWTSGRILWNHDISSYTGMIADSNTVFISDAKSYVWAFGADNGLVNWRQDKLAARTASGPASMGDYVVVGDAEGYLHWLSKRDGHFAARVKVGSAIYAAPVVENNVLYVLTNNGNLSAYTLNR